MLHGGRESLLVLKDKLAGRVSQHVRAIEKRSTDKCIKSDQVLSESSLITDNETNPFLPLNTVSLEQSRIESALMRKNKFVRKTIDPAEMTRSVKRLQNTAKRRVL